jgi:hypothetical protein
MCSLSAAASSPIKDPACRFRWRRSKERRFGLLIVSSQLGLDLGIGSIFGEAQCDEDDEVVLQCRLHVEMLVTRSLFKCNEDRDRLPSKRLGLLQTLVKADNCNNARLDSNGVDLS